MARYAIDVRRPIKEIRPLSLVEHPTNPVTGDRIGFTNYYMELNGQPFVGICGEFHYSRYPASEWETEIIKIKQGGVNIISSYVFWIHHEEIQGQFRWDGDYNLRAFVELCAKHQMAVIVRVGPFVHGECRNGGLPDWLFARPFEVRSNDPEYLALVERLYAQIGAQLRGLFHQDGGPIIAVQLENEFMHASAPWELVPRQAHEWIGGGSGGLEHMRKLKEIALRTGLDAPFYTSTGWGGAPVLEGEILPLYGGYAFCPWNVDAQRPTHAPTTEYLFQHYHQNGARTIGFDPPYPPESYPFACCEMGGGMQVWYQYRFVVPGVSVEAMALHKLAGGCNFLGYYMYHGGSNPVGQRGYLNEYVTPKISYDFQAPLGEFGQTRESYHRLRLLHLFLATFGDTFCRTATVLPASNDAITPTDTTTLRFAARVHQQRGFLFINTYQDHVEMADQEGVAIAVQLPDRQITVPRQVDLMFPREQCAIWPFNMALGDVELISATAQPITFIEHEGETVYFFFTPGDATCEYCFAAETLADAHVDAGRVLRDGDALIVLPAAAPRSQIRLTSATGQRVTICTLSHTQALGLWQAELWGRRRIVLSQADVLPRDGELELLQLGSPDLSFSVFPAPTETLHSPFGQLQGERDDLFTRYRVQVPPRTPQLELVRHSDSKISVRLQGQNWEGLDDILLHIAYQGDVGYASVEGTLISDNFANGAPWELGLARHRDVIEGKAIDIVIAPLRRGHTVVSDSAMALQQTFVGEIIANIDSISAYPRYRVRIRAVEA